MISDLTTSLGPFYSWLLHPRDPLAIELTSQGQSSQQREDTVVEPGACRYPRGAILGSETHSPSSVLALFVLPALFVLLTSLSFVPKESVHWKSQLKQGEIKREVSERDGHYARLETALGINSLESLLTLKLSKYFIFCTWPDLVLFLWKCAPLVVQKVYPSSPGLCVHLWLFPSCQGLTIQ